MDKNLKNNSNFDFFEEKISKKNYYNKILKNFLKVSLAFILGFCLSFSYVYLTEIITPLFSNSKDDFEYINIDSDLDNKNFVNHNSFNIPKIIENVNSSVVSITTVNTKLDLFRGIVNYQDAGSGIIFHKTGTEVYIVTNYHVIDGADPYGIGVSLDISQEPILAKVIAKDSNNDLAILSVPYKKLKKQGKIYVAKFASDENNLVGDYVIAIGNSVGEGNTATLGIISAKSKEVVFKKRSINVIQTTAAINPGNSGGPLINLNGEVIGINTAKVSGQGVEGIGYSISSVVAMPLIQQMMNNSNPPTLGVEITDVSNYSNSKYKAGALIVNVLPKSSAQEYGLRLYDIITSVNNTPILNSEQLVKEIKKYKAKETIKIKIIREGELITLKVKLKPNN